MTGKVRTVLRDVDPKEVGRTLTHEHLSMAFTHFYREPPKQLASVFKNKIELKEVGYLRQYPYSSQYNLLLDDEDAKQAVLNDLKYYKKFGGGTIVENTTDGIKRDTKFMKRASEESGVHVVAGSGYYIQDTQDGANLHHTEEKMYNQMMKEVSEGFADNPSVKAGFLGEIASVWPLKDFEKRAIRASAQVQESLSCGVSFHPHRDTAAPFEIIRLYLEAGGKADKAVMSHLDRTLQETEALLEFAKLGTICQFDLFGVEVSLYQLNITTNMPSDAQRLDMVQQLVDEGAQDRVFLSHDIHTKHRLADFGGHGYSHIINNVLPRMEARGFSKQLIDDITIHNPSKWLSF